MNRNTGTLRTYIVLMLLISVGATALRTVACLSDLDYEYGYFNNKTFIDIANNIALFGSLFMLTYPILAKKAALKPSFTSAATYIPTGLVSVALLFLSFTLFAKSEAISPLPLFSSLSDARVTLCLLSGVLALVSIVHFFLNAFIEESRATLRAYFAIGTIAFLSIYTSYLYFSTDLPINSPNKIVDQMAVLLCAVFFLYEARISLGRDLFRGYSVFGLISALLCLYSSVPSLVVYFVNGEIISASVEANLFTLTLFIFITMRLILTSALPECGENGFVAAVKANAEKRAKTVEEIEKNAEEAYTSVQMTIDDIFSTEVENSESVDKEENNEEEEKLPIPTQLEDTAVE